MRWVVLIPNSQSLTPNSKVMSWILGVESAGAALSAGCVVAIGVFDGVHRGHQALLVQARARAQGEGVPCVALTFDPHPSEVVRPQHPTPLLCPLAHRIERLLQYGADMVVVQPFTEAFAQLAPEAFVQQILVERLHARVVVVGEDFRFGHRQRGDVALLKRVGQFEVVTVPPVLDEAGERISSSRIRRLVHGGALGEAAQLLSEPFYWAGVVIRGESRGQTLGYPTANLTPLGRLVRPPEGVYACFAHLEGRRYGAAVSVGAPPMFPHSPPTVEAYLLDFPPRLLYGRVIALQFLQRLRSQRKFESLDALVEQMARDVEQTQQIVANSEW
ncbi:MAG: bifunctional riboflavin kinase/FAD synthetase [Fimbriimonadales bacterium]|nr:bifunctional riboflavin kinase/FAD synthetase [Fimbriimonadales bacterium]